jgi:gliding motility-associated-like protein
LTAVATGGNGGFVYDWSSPTYTGNPLVVTPGATTTYSVTATDAMGCVSITNQTVTVTVRPPLSVVASNDVAICPGGSATLSATASGGDGTYMYSWMPGGGSASTFTVSPLTNTTYTVTLTDGCTSISATDVVTVTLLPPPVVDFSVDVQEGCAPLCVNFTDNTTGGTGAIWNWSFEGHGSSDDQNPTNICFNAGGPYDVTLSVTTDLGCYNTYTLSDLITVHAQPVAAFNYGPQPASIAAPTISFNDMSSNATSWSWDFGDPASNENFSNMSSPSHTYADTGTYCVTLTVTNTPLCTSTVTDCNLVINPQFTFYIPSSFSPNGDGLNDIFAPKGEHIDEFTMRIYDRWGQLAYISKDVFKGWDGRVITNGEIAQQDTYVYMIELTDRIGEKHQYIGSVTIIK